MARHRKKSDNSNTLRILFILGVVLLALGLIIFAVSAYINNRETSNTASSSTEQTLVSSSETNEDTAPSQTDLALDLEALANGDYNSAVGTWLSSNGNSLTFNAEGLESSDIQGTSDFTVTPYQQLDDNTYLATLTSADGSLVYDLYFIKAGSELPADYFAEGYTDTSDRDKDRLYITSDLVGGEDYADNVLYRQ
ncbi:hypothetical protein DDV21_004985 [Streptococcus chenjunshii]|uniref:DUF6287 domain-containing protein n=1 Tax=Streptococcus chenjunshii TaxID=2173853 RepID=A0A372KQQ0_9STRE|nr:DUF6287 domain-containing protein [Streptococcus chenjunshii]AXQ78477.1 hypothetical protein DDV21_004985 [Streptococcus chenjunshii]RFU52062.1 hypothetical protein DDV22_01060 [Streptococcus chenjunshii]RFU54254.1 hypothetical protein DDV23_01615 [Streptococcus chenjunshii]